MSPELAWPDPNSVTFCNAPGGRHYKSLDGSFTDPLPGPTTALKVLGLSTNALIAWSANTERAAVLEAVGDVICAGGIAGDGPQEFINAVEAKLGKARQHVKLVSKAADIGTAAHAAVQRMLRIELGQPVGPEQELPKESLWAFMAFQDYWKVSGLKAVRSEQPVWSVEVGFAGTVDIIAEDADGRIGVLDIKTSKGTYLDHHLQVAAYCHAARNWAPIEWGRIIRLPKNTSDPEFEVVELGQLYGGRTMSEDQLFEAFKHALACWKVLMGAA
jgi:hypothetical protein